MYVHKDKSRKTFAETFAVKRKLENSKRFQLGMDLEYLMGPGR